MIIIYWEEEYVCAIKVNAEYSVLTNTEIGLQINADKSKYVVMSRYQNAGRSYGITNDNIYFEILRELK